VSTTNGRVEATDILSARDALVAAATAADQAKVFLGMVTETAAARDKAISEGVESWDAPAFDGDYLRQEAAKAAQVAEGLSVYAATVGKWAAR
jgi:hypothetical protein